MAAPFVTGIAAVLFSQEIENSEEVIAELKKIATRGVLNNLPNNNTPNILAYLGGL